MYLLIWRHMFPKMILIREYILDTAFLKTKEKQRQEGPEESPRGANFLFLCLTYN